MDVFLKARYARGEIELLRENFAKAHDAFQACLEHPDSLRQIAHIYRNANYSPGEVIDAYIRAFETGDMCALPYLLSVIREHVPQHPRAHEFILAGESALVTRNPDYLFNLYAVLANSDLDAAIEYLCLACDAGSEHAISMLIPALFHSENKSAVRKVFKKHKFGNPIFRDIDHKFSFDEMVNEKTRKYPLYKGFRSWDSAQNLMSIAKRGHLGYEWYFHFKMYKGMDLPYRREDFLNYVLNDKSSENSLWNSPFALYTYATEFYAAVEYKDWNSNPAIEMERRLNELGLGDLYQDFCADQLMENTGIFDELDNEVPKPIKPSKPAKHLAKTEKLYEAIANEFEAFEQGKGSIAKLRKLFIDAEKHDQDDIESMISAEQFGYFINDAEFDDDEIGENCLKNSEDFRFFFPFAKKFSWDAEIAIARSPYAPEDVLGVLLETGSFEQEWSVPEQLALREDHMWILERLAKHEEAAVRWQVAQNPKTPIRIMSALCNDAGVNYNLYRPDENYKHLVVYAVSINPSVSPQIIEEIKNSLDAVWPLVSKSLGLTNADRKAFEKHLKARLKSLA